MKATIKQLIPFVCAVASTACVSIKKTAIYDEQYDLPRGDTYYVQNIYHNSNGNEILLYLRNHNTQTSILTIPTNSMSNDIFYAQENDTIIIKRNKPVNISLQNRISAKVR